MSDQDGVRGRVEAEGVQRGGLERQERVEVENQQYHQGPQYEQRQQDYEEGLVGMAQEQEQEQYGTGDAVAATNSAMPPGLEDEATGARLQRKRGNEGGLRLRWRQNRSLQRQSTGGRTEDEAGQGILYLPWCRPPLARQQGLDYLKYSQRPVVASYLVLDLTVARALANLGAAYDKPTASLDRIDVFILLFLPIFWQWLKTSHMTNRFDVEDFVSTVIFAINMVLMSYVGVNIGTCATRLFDDNTKCVQYTGSMVALRAVHIMHLLYAFYFNRRFSRFFTRQLAIEGTIFTMWTIVSFVTTNVKAMWWLTISFELVAFVLPHLLPQRFTLKPEERLPLHPDLLASRHRRFASMALAFVVSNAIINVNQAETFFTQGEAFRITLTVFLVIGLKLQYFDLVDVDRPGASNAYACRHPLVRTQEHDIFRVAWEMSHFSLNLSTVLVGSTLRDYVPTCASESCSSLLRYWLCRPLAFASFFTVMQQLMSSGGIGGYRKRRFQKVHRILFRLGGILVTFIFPYVVPVHNDDTFAALVTMWFIFTVLFDLWARMPSKDKIDIQDSKGKTGLHAHLLDDEDA